MRAPRWVDACATSRPRSPSVPQWIVRSLAEWRARRRDVMPREWKIRRADPLPRRAAGARGLSRRGEPTIAADLFHLTVRHPQAHDEGQIAHCVREWLRDQAWTLVAARVAHYVRRVSAARRRRFACRTRAANGEAAMRRARSASTGGSCSCRRCSPNTSSRTRSRTSSSSTTRARFWAVVETLLPGHAALRRELDDWTALLAA